MKKTKKGTFSHLRHKVEQQLILENKSRPLGADDTEPRPPPQSWRDSISLTTKDETDLPPGRHLIKQVIPPVAAAIEEFVERVANGGAGRKPTAVRLLAQIDDAEVATYLVVRTVVNAVAQGLPIHKGANEISDALVHHIEMTQFTAAIQAGR